MLHFARSKTQVLSAYATTTYPSRRISYSSARTCSFLAEGTSTTVTVANSTDPSGSDDTSGTPKLSFRGDVGPDLAGEVGLDQYGDTDTELPSKVGVPDPLAGGDGIGLSDVNVPSCRSSYSRALSTSFFREVKAWPRSSAFICAVRCRTQ